MKILFIGTGLIGGSFSLALKEKGLMQEAGGFSRKKANLEKSIELRIIDQMFTSMDEGIRWADWIILSIPVNAIRKLLPEILDKMNKDQCVIDFGSTKAAICKTVREHPSRNQFIAAHPIAGTEYSGPEAAFPGLFQGKSMLICEPELSDPKLLETFKGICNHLTMKVDFLGAIDHDRHLAYISHLSHVTSYALSHTVLEKEKDGSVILEMAGSGFASTVRLAKSSPEMWAPIFIDNKDMLLEAINGYSDKVQRLKELLESEDLDGILDYLKKGGEIKKILK